jgi:hypothetical protein
MWEVFECGNYTDLRAQGQCKISSVTGKTGDKNIADCYCGE